MPVPTASRKPTAAGKLRESIKASRTKAAFVPGLPPLLDDLDAFLAEHDARVLRLEQTVGELVNRSLAQEGA